MQFLKPFSPTADSGGENFPVSASAQWNKRNILPSPKCFTQKKFYKRYREILMHHHLRRLRIDIEQEFLIYFEEQVHLPAATSCATEENLRTNFSLKFVFLSLLGSLSTAFITVDGISIDDELWAIYFFQYCSRCRYRKREFNRWANKVMV